MTENEMNDSEKSALHNILHGTSEDGKSFLTEKLAEQNKVSVEEAEAFIQKISAHNDSSSEPEDRDIFAKSKRTLALIETYCSDCEPSELGQLHDICTCYLDIETPTWEQLKMLLTLIPEDCIFEGMKWGYSDSVVRDNMAEFAMEHKKQLRSRLL